MAMVPAKCTQCGGQLTVDSEKDAAVCEFCGTPFIVEKAINNYNTTVINKFDNATVNIVAGDAKNFLKLAKDALKSKNYVEAYDYANKVLELETSNAEAWLTKMYAIEWLASIDNLREDEVILCAKNAMKYFSEEEKEKKNMEIYKYFMGRAAYLMQFALDNNNNRNECSELAAIFKSSNYSRNYTIQFDRCGWYLAVTEVAVKLKEFIPEKVIKDEFFQNLIYDMAKTFVIFCRDNARRLALYDNKQDDETVKNFKKRLQRIKVGLNKDTEEISESKIDGSTQYTFGDRLGFLAQNLFGPN